MDTIWTSTDAWPTFSPGQSFTITTPALPGYIYKHTLRHQYYLSVVFAYQPLAPGLRQRLVINTYDSINTPVYAVFTDPYLTFPNHHLYDQPAQVLETRPWYEIMDDAMIHITIGGSVRTVTTEGDAMVRLTPDLYVFPNRPDGPSSSSFYNPMAISQFYGYNLASGSSHATVRFNLYGMMLNTNGDCKDFAAYLECQARCMGVHGVQKIRLGTPYGTGFDYKPCYEMRHECVPARKLCLSPDYVLEYRRNI